ncbi:MAG: hypothetical protein QNJ75_12245, partial [Acidimicrobiia bacterium]|nr:hypothetical protein [Acidimicrobiia bacterium]
MVPAHRPEVGGAGDTVLGPGLPVVDVTVDRWHAAAGVNAGGMQQLCLATLRGNGLASGDAAVDRLLGVRIDEHP